MSDIDKIITAGTAIDSSTAVQPRRIQTIPNFYDQPGDIFKMPPVPLHAGKRSITLKKDEICKLVEDYLNDHVLKNTVRVKRVLENHDEFRVEFDEMLDELAGVTNGKN